MQEEIQQAAIKWADAIETHNPDLVVSQYHHDGGLWGTFAMNYLHGREEIRGYFEELFLRENLTCAFLSGTVKKYGDIAFFSGSYEFKWDENEQIVSRKARFTFVYKLEFEGWLIMEHHSSLFPFE